MPNTGAVSQCPRCNSPVPRKGRGRPAIWCSQTCRRAAYEERRAAESGAVAVEVVDRVSVAEHDLSECVDRVTGSPAATRRVLKALAELGRGGVLTSDPKWSSTVAAARALKDAIDPPPTAPRRHW